MQDYTTQHYPSQKYPTQQYPSQNYPSQDTSMTPGSGHSSILVDDDDDVEETLVYAYSYIFSWPY